MTLVAVPRPLRSCHSTSIMLCQCRTRGANGETLVRPIKRQPRHAGDGEAPRIGNRDRAPPLADVEAFSINLQAVPSFEAFGQFLETTNPFAFWAQAVQLAWLPWFGATWLGATRALTLPWNAGATLQPPESPP